MLQNLSPPSRSLFSYSPESRNRCGPTDHHSGERRGDRLLKALYVPGNLHHDQEATEVETRCFLFPGPTGLRDLDVHCVRIHWS